MTPPAQRYRYVGPQDLAPAAGPGAGAVITSVTDLAAWLADRHERERCEPFTYVVDLTGRLRLAARRSEHVACAGGQDVLAAGEISFCGQDGNWVVEEVTNQSTGYCPAPESWQAVQQALDRAGLAHPDTFTDTVIFRKCPCCGQRNVVRDQHYICAVCESDLPREWNFH